METTMLVVGTRKLSVPRLFKRLLQVAMAVALTSALFFVVIVGNGYLVGKGTTFKAGIDAWLAFIKRPDTVTTMVLTAFVTVVLVYWQRNQERKVGTGRP